MPIVSTGDGLSLGVSLVLLEIPDDSWVRQSIVSALDLLTIEDNWRQIGSNTPDLSARVFSLILQTLLFDYEPPMSVPVGSIMMHGAETAPLGWLLCDGSAISRATYSLLFDEIGVVWGVGDGTTTFNLPDFKYRSPMGVSTNPNLNIAEAAGEAAHALTQTENASHSHVVTDPGHHHGANTNTNFLGQRSGGVGAINNGTTYGLTTNTSSATTGITLGDSGNGVPHNTVHPVRGVPFIIFAGV